MKTAMRKIMTVICVCVLAMLFYTISACAYVDYDKTGYPNTYTNTGDYATDLVNVALTQVGYHETPGLGDYTKYSYWFYGRDYNLKWCGLFVSWCADQADIPTDIIHKNSHVCQVTYDTYSEYTSGGDYFGGTPYDFGSKDPAPGDLFFSTTQEGYEKATHVGIIWKVDSSYIYTIEGNTHFEDSDGNLVGYVAKRMYNRITGYQYYSRSKTTSSYVHILFYVHPDYKQSDGDKASGDTASVADVSSEALSVQPVSDFSDVPASSYYSSAVQWAVKKNVTSGTTTTTFSPAQACTRGQVAAFLYRFWGAEMQIDDDSFSDVSRSQYYYYPITWCKWAEITYGTSTTTFGPERTVTRAQFLTMLYRSAGCPFAQNTGKFTDVPSGAFYEEAVYWAVQNGITYGTTDKTFCPDEQCTRAQTVTFLYRYAQSEGMQ